MDIALTRDEIINQLWLAYKKTSEYKSGLNKAILKHNKLVEDQEKEGLKRIYRHFIKNLLELTISNEKLKNRKIEDWLNEWKKMHKLLFYRILKKCGNWREENVRFGSPGDEDLYHIPDYSNVPKELIVLADNIKKILNKTTVKEEVYQNLAIIHYQFIRIHPFVDGNGRIGRTLTDQLAIFFGLPPAIAGYPRHKQKNRQRYHEAIHSCIFDPECRKLALWIKSYIDRQLAIIA